SCLTLLLSLTSLFTSACFPLSLHDALPISGPASFRPWWCSFRSLDRARGGEGALAARYRTPGRGLLRYRDRSSHQRPDLLPHRRSEEHTSELQSRFELVCRRLLEKKKSSTM